MTIVIALRAVDGLVMASDSQSTESTGSVRGTTEKLFPLTTRALCGGSGDGQVLTEIRHELESVSDFLCNAPNIGQALVSRSKGILETHYANYTRVPGIATTPPIASLLACGYKASGQPWIVEVDYTSHYTFYEGKGFHAIGSAAGFAQLGNALLSHYRVTERPLRWGLVVAHRVIDAAIRTSAQGVGPPIQMWSVTPSEGPTQVGPQEMASLTEAVGGWEEEERAALDRILNPPVEDPPPLPPERPG